MVLFVWAARLISTEHDPFGSLIVASIRFGRPRSAAGAIDQHHTPALAKPTASSLKQHEPASYLIYQRLELAPVQP